MPDFQLIQFSQNHGMVEVGRDLLSNLPAQAGPLRDGYPWPCPDGF